MRYRDAVSSAPPGSASFRAADVARLSRATLRLVFHPGPAAPPLEDVAAALGREPAALRAIAEAIEPARGERLLRLSMRPHTEAEVEEAATRLVRGLFWPLVYDLAPGRWEALAEAEPISSALLAGLPIDGATVVEVAAGGGRLTQHLAPRAARLVIFDGSLPLCAVLRHRLPGVAVSCAMTHRLPLRDGFADVVAACAAMSPDPPLGGEAALAELDRVLKPGGLLALIAVESPGWFEARGFVRRDYVEPDYAPAPEVVEFFGPLTPPHTLVLRRRA